MKTVWFRVMLIMVLVILTVSLAGCEEGAEKEDSGYPQRIISLAPSNTEILFALGLGDRVVGVTEYCNYPPEAASREKVGGFSTVDMEKIIELDPDLILAANIHKDTDAPELERRGFRVLVLDPGTIDEVIENITLVGATTGVEEVSEALVADLRSRIAAVTEKVSSLPETERPGVFYITWHDPLWTLGRGTITHELIEMAGGRNIVADVDGHGQTDIETVIWRNPQVILASAGHGSAADSPVGWARTEKRLSETDARRDDRIYQVDADLVTRPGPRIVEGLELIATLIHPDLFAE